VKAFIEDLGASGAYWAAASADSISANSGAAIGSIGVFMVVQDTSEQAEKLGIKVHVVKAGEMKAAGTWGTEVSQDFLDYLKTEIIDPTYESFISGIMRGRKSTRDSVLSLATGRVWHAERAREMGLIDAVESFESFMESFSKEVVMSATSETTTAAGNQPRAATLGQLKATFKESSAEWRESQIEAGSTLEEAAAAYGIYCSEQVNAAKRAQAEAEEKAKAAEATKTVDDLGGKARGNFTQVRKQSGRGEAYAKMEEAIAGHMKSGISRTKAYNLAAEENPELLQQIITEAN
jgi:ClpP class serine protease